MSDITLTFAADESAATEAFSNVGDAATTMGDEVETSTGAFDSVGEAADGLRSPVRGVAATFRGVNSTMDGFGKIAEGDVMGGLSSIAMGASSLVRGLTSFLIPALSSTVSWLGKTRLATIAQSVASGITSAATKVWAGIQAVFNVIMALNPVVLIIAAILLLVGVIVLIATKTRWFQNIWQAIWSVIGDPVKKVWGWIRDTLWPGIQKVWNGIVAGVKMVWRGVQTYFGLWRGIIDKVMGWVGDIPSRIGRAFRGLGSAISAPFRAGFDAVKRFWNNTIGGRGFDIPSWVPFGIGGKSFRFPFFHQGGIVPGAPGQEMLAVLQAGERVTPAGRAGSGTVLEIRSGGSRLDDLLVEVLGRAVRVRGGNVQLVLGTG